MLETRAGVIYHEWQRGEDKSAEIGAAAAAEVPRNMIRAHVQKSK